MKKIKKWIKILIIIVIFSLVIILNKEFVINLLKNISNSFNRTVIEEDRYILLFNGLKSTILISNFSIIFGTLLGFVLFLLQKSKVKFLNILSFGFVRFLQGVPVTVLLLTFYFGIFGTINIAPIIVAIIAFSIYFS